MLYCDGIMQDSPRQFDGKWIVLSAAELAIVHETRDAQRPITVRYSKIVLL